MSSNLAAPVRRTTNVVSDLGRSLAFDRDPLGVDVYFEGHIGNPRASAVTALDCEGIRRVVLNVGGTEYGMAGLMQIRGARPTALSRPAAARLPAAEGRSFAVRGRSSPRPGHRAARGSCVSSEDHAA